MSYSNLWLGHSEIDFSNVNEKGEVSLVTADSYLSNIQYIVDIHVPKDEIPSLVTGNVGVMYTTSGDDFTDPDTDERGNVRVYQELNGYSLTFGAGALSRDYEATFRGLYTQQVNGGADDITLTSASAKLTSSDPVGSDSIKVPFNTVGPASNLLPSAIPRAISAQMQGFASDENLLRLVAAANSYNNLMTFPLLGSLEKDNSNVSAMHEEIRGKTVDPEFDAGSVKSILGHDDLDNKDRLVSSVSPGHLIVAALFNVYPPRADGTANTHVVDNNIDMSGTGAEPSRLWKRVNQADLTGDGRTDLGDFLMLNNTSAIDEEIVLQYVLRTKMTLIARDGSTQLNSTKKSPNNDDAAANEVHILYNIRFDH